MIHILIILLILLLPPPVFSEDIAQATQGDVTVTLTNEDCRLTEQVANLPSRVTWKDKNETLEGCWSAVIGVVVMFFEDKEVAVGPQGAFLPIPDAI